jgi:hypothetical protein
VDGNLQWHFRTKGAAPEEPILRAIRNIQIKNAVLTWDGDRVPRVVDGKETYLNPRQPEWPTAEFVLGNVHFSLLATMAFIDQNSLACAR